MAEDNEKRNFWKITTGILAILFLGTLFYFTTVETTGEAINPYSSNPNDNANVLSMSDAKVKALDYIEDNLVPPDVDVSITDVTEKEGVYELTILLTSSQGTQEINSYITKDGSIFFPGGYETAVVEEQPQTEESQMSCEDIPKKDRSVVELFTFSYCPFGTQYEKGLIPTVELLGDKADIKVIFIGAMHGLHEEIESKRQLCIREEQPDKYWAYLKCFAYSEGMKECGSKFYREFDRDETKMAECVEPYINECFDKANVDKSKVTDCMENRADGYYETDNQLAGEHGIASSPTIRINGIIIPGRTELAGRSPEEIKNAICCGFKEELPECEQSLSTETASPGFGGGTSSPSGGTC